MSCLQWEPQSPSDFAPTSSLQCVRAEQALVAGCEPSSVSTSLSLSLSLAQPRFPKGSCESPRRTCQVTHQVTTVHSGSASLTARAEGLCWDRNGLCRAARCDCLPRRMAALCEPHAQGGSGDRACEGTAEPSGLAGKVWLQPGLECHMWFGGFQVSKTEPSSPLIPSKRVLEDPHVVPLWDYQRVPRSRIKTCDKHVPPSARGQRKGRGSQPGRRASAGSRPEDSDVWGESQPAQGHVERGSPSDTQEPTSSSCVPPAPRPHTQGPTPRRSA